ncbi:MAG: lamin tail domain-containing protein [Minisyncoccota bacterium]
MRVKINNVPLQIVFHTIILCPLFLAHPQTSVHAQTLPPVIISEVQIVGQDTNDDFIELYNTTDHAINISDWQLRKKTKGDKTPRGTLLHEFETLDCDTPHPFHKTDTIEPHGFLLWTNKGGKASFISLFDVQNKNEVSPILANNNSLAIFDDKEKLIDSVTWGVCVPPKITDCFLPKNSFSQIMIENNPEEGTSLVRDTSTGNWLPEFALTPTPTASTENRCSASPSLPGTLPIADNASLTPSAIRFNEIFPNPKAKQDMGEFIELFNAGEKKQDISGWSIRDATKSGKYVFPNKTFITPNGYLLISDTDFTFALNNTKETLSLFDAQNILINTAQYATSKDDVSLNYTATEWRGGTPTPGAPNSLNNLPETREKIPKKGFSNIALQFYARGKDVDRDTLKYTWNFGDGHKSYLKNTTHTYEKNGRYNVTLKTTDGKDDTLETFTVKIESYDPPKIRIIALVANPVGKDTDNEWLILENRHKKAVNLRGFGITTGWKKLINHPINQDIILKPKQKFTLTREHAHFSLPNQKGKIELRAPNGEILQKIKYKTDTPIKENAVYQKMKEGGWIWTTINEPTKMSSIDVVTDIDPTTEESVEPIENVDLEQPTPAIDTILPTTDTSATSSDIPLSTQTHTTPLSPMSSNVHQKNREMMIRTLLASGTHASLPDTITLTDMRFPTYTFTPTEHYAVTFVKASMAHLNSAFNQWLNKKSQTL